MLFYGRSTCDTGLISRAQQSQMSHGPHSIVLGGDGGACKAYIWKSWEEYGF